MPREDANTPMFTLTEYAAMHNVSRGTVRKWIKQARVPSMSRGGGATRAGAILILTADRPPRLPPGGLSPEQRAAWGK